MNSFAVSFIFTCLSVCQQESSAGAVVTGITQLQPLYDIDNNVVSCQATKSPDGHTYIAIVTPKDAWTKELIITSSTVFGYSLKCGNKYGEPMSGLNSNAKMNIVDLGISNATSSGRFRNLRGRRTDTQTYGNHSIFDIQTLEKVGGNNIYQNRGRNHTTTNNTDNCAANPFF